MFDNINVSAMPVGGDAYAGYVNGNWPTFPDVVAKFPGKPVLSIAVTSAGEAMALDIETGDAAITDAAAWYHAQIKRGLTKVVFYTSTSKASALINTLTSAGISRADYFLWTAHYSGKAHLCSSACGFGALSADATQWTDKSTNGCDESTMSAAFLSWVESKGVQAPSKPTGAVIVTIDPSKSSLPAENKPGLNLGSNYFLTAREDGTGAKLKHGGTGVWEGEFPTAAKPVVGMSAAYYLVYIGGTKSVAVMHAITSF